MNRELRDRYFSVWSRTERRIFLIFGMLIAAGIGSCIWMEIAHPCVRYEEQICKSSVCTFMDENGFCFSWSNDEYACDVCVESQP